ncbi:serine/threonine protein phosphatase [Shewanella rhizosphaerae]|uniref:serine/threonine protein phosphatase n=1 Tax=Shewanella TaxID=22 RepID=UPI001C65E1E7|nr:MULTISPECIES: serine/threonine protein phosphatase [Shewanella]QYJ83982.1 serine/threonine protein phosphatase [Shewanella aegiceratis]QYK14485.1 serine/threonine protein phosphatase [Shewanella rhizosphaerae]
MTVSSLQHVIDKLLVENQGERIVSFEHQGRKYWLKQSERLTGAMRWLKSQPQAALQLEISTLTQLAKRGAPVPELVASGEGFLVVADVGMPVNGWLNADISDAEKLKILQDSATGLAHLHLKGLAHGRPALRDICWEEGDVAFIDFEANQQDSDMHRQQIRDLLVYIHSLYRYIGPHPEIAEPVIAAYRAAGGESLWQASKQEMAKWQWLNYLIAPLRSIGGKDLRPVYWLLRHFKQTL